MRRPICPSHCTVATASDVVDIILFARCGIVQGRACVAECAVADAFVVAFDAELGEEVLAEYRNFADILKETVSKGISAAVYTQTTDVEVEVNGLMTYDRDITKMDVGALRAINLEVIASAPGE